MTVDTTVNKQPHTGDGVIVAFDFTFKYLAASEIKVYLAGSDTPELTSTYTVTAAVGDGGTVTFNTAPGNGVAILIRRELPLTQGSKVPTVDKIGRGLLETMVDRVVMICQQISEEAGRALKFSDESTSTATFPEPDADKFVGWNSAGTDLENKDVVTTGLVIPSMTGKAGQDVIVNPGETSFTFQELAAIADVLAGTDTAKRVTPDVIASLWEKGSDIASAATLSIPATGGGYFDVTGSVTVTAISQSANLREGRRVVLEFAAALTLTHNATSLILPSGANITTAAGDVAEFVCIDASNNYWRCVGYMRASGLAVAGGLAPVHLHTTTVSSAVASVDIDTAVDWTAYDYYIAQIENIQPVTDTANFWMRVKNSGGYVSASGSYKDWSDYGSGNVFSDSLTAMRIDGTVGLGNLSGEESIGTVKIYNMNDGTRNSKFIWDTLSHTSTNRPVRVVGSGLRGGSGEVNDGVQFLMSTGNVAGNGGKIHISGANFS